ncbi:2Fe-2S iron-sulfur cluster-binding protein [Wenzhouxiangella sp. EGI_FJ10409]|uniref:2Fe-2S iron-sulfur cluster-binding protein n=1 Tax=Wenzhouxiangella sp. EGI_FJ10409 TaxID=3243767 RepID=UPI0035D80430
MRHSTQVRYRQQSVEVRTGETLLSALLRQGLPVRYSCRAGACHTCLMRATKGRPPEDACRGLPSAQVEQGYFLPCLCRPTEPLEVEQPSLPRRATRCEVLGADMVAPDVIEVLPPTGDATDGGRERRAPPRDPELWRRLGNGRVLREVLRDFYDIAFEDEHLGPYFQDVTRQRLREKQYSFLRSLMLGTRDYMGQRPRNAHHWMVIPGWLFDYRLELMEQCMRDHGLTEPWVGRWHALEDFFRGDIVKQAPWPRRIGESDVLLDGLEEAVLEDGGCCDGCERIIERGELVSFQLREGSLYCGDCRRLSSKAVALGRPRDGDANG